MRTRRKHPVLYWGLIGVLLVFFITDATAMVIYARTGSATRVHDAGYRIGYMVGVALADALLMAIPLALLVLLVAGIVALVRRLRR